MTKYPTIPTIRPLSLTHFNARALIEHRMKEHGFELLDLARQMGHHDVTPIRHLFSGRNYLSNSRHFDQLCEVLGLTPEECEAIRTTERRSSRRNWTKGTAKGTAAPE